MASVVGGGAGSWPLLRPARGIMELYGVRHRRWSRVAAVLRACQGAWIRRLKLDNGRSHRERSPTPVGVRAELF